MTLLSRIPLKVWAVVFIALFALGLFGAYKYQVARAERAEARAATADALDRVAIQTPIIRQEQKDKEREVSNIPGADDRLPDGFGRGLQRVRDGKNPRQP